MAWWDPFEEMRRMMEEMDRIFESSFKPRYRKRMGEEWREPLVDVWETDNEVIVTAELPGVRKEDIDLNITEDSLELKVELKSEVKKEEEGFREFARSYKGFYRMIALPNKVIPEKASATFENGVLEVKIPKTEEAKRKGVKVKVK